MSQRFESTWLLVLAGGAGIVAACSSSTPNPSSDALTPAERARAQTLSPLLNVEPETSNQFANDAAAATLGQKFFFERSIAGPIKIASDLGAVGDTGKISCGDCHVMTAWGTDSSDRSKPNSLSLGIEWGTRNTPPLVNVGFYKWFYWEGRADSLWMQAALATENPQQQGSDRLRVAHVVFKKYKADYEAVFKGTLDPALDPTAADAARFPASGKPKKTGDPDGAWEGMTPADQTIVTQILVNWSKAIAAYERLLVSRNAPFDKFVAGDDTALSSAQKRGFRLFIGKAGCVQCHSGPLFSDNQFHNTGIPQTGDKIPAADNGRFDAIAKLTASPFNTNGAFSDDKATGKLTGLAAAETDKSAWRTKHLRQVAMTGPYMHTGQFKTLTEVVQHYNKGGATTGFFGTKDKLMVALNLSDAEVSDIVAFLEALTGEPPKAELTADTSAK